MLTLEEVARKLGTEIITARQYHNQATRRRREGSAGLWDLPEPSETVGRSPRWDAAVIDAWIAARPGRGNGKKFSEQKRHLLVSGSR